MPFLLPMPIEAFAWALLRENSHARSPIAGMHTTHFAVPQKRPGSKKADFCFPGSSRTARVPPIKQPLALGVVSTRFRAPQAKGAEAEKLEMYLYVK